MPSITTWTRLEPRTRNEDIRVGLQAKIHDPLWLLARQWQLGEFKGEDAASPIMARLQAECARLTRYRPGRFNDGVATAIQNYDSNTIALETLVEREEIHNKKVEKLHLAVEAGLHFLRLLADRGLSAYRNAYLTHYALPFPSEMEKERLDRDSLQFWQTMAKRVPDGERLYLDLRAALRPTVSRIVKPSVLPIQPIIKEVDREKVIELANTWLQWYETIFSEPTTSKSSWLPERMEYEFAVAAKTTVGEVVLTAPEYATGDLDWHTFNIYPGASLGASVDVEQISQTTIPVPVSYPGMPASRWWEFEDARSDFSVVQAEPEDLAKLLLLEFAFIYSNDWFIVPVEIKVGSLCRISSLVITDSFGERILIRAANEIDKEGMDWSIFTLSTDRRSNVSKPVKSQPLLFLPPVLATNLQSKAIEEVLFLRDENANMAWAVEQIIENRIGQPINRAQSQKQTVEKRPSNSSLTPLVYRFATNVPDYWYPLLPSPLQENSFQFKLGSQSGSLPKGAILKTATGEKLTIQEEEIPRTGLRVTRAYQYTRWLDGLIHLWMGRKKESGRGQAASELRFDILE
ncbi:MAG: hypothetical protein AB1489_25090 [Acidobacteriota bacterium]